MTPTPWAGAFDVPVPEGYALRHIETGARGDNNSYRGVFLYARTHERPVGYFEINTDMSNMQVVYTLVFGGKHKMHDTDLAALLIRACAYDRVAA